MNRAYICVNAIAEKPITNKFYEISITYNKDNNTANFYSLIKPNVVFNSQNCKATSYKLADFRLAPTFAEITLEIIEILTGLDIYYFDAFSERVFRSAFKEIGYPLRKSPNILIPKLKKLMKVGNCTSPLDVAAHFNIEISCEAFHCFSKVLCQIYEHLENCYNGSNKPLEQSIPNTTSVSKKVLSNIPNRPGVYVFKNKRDEIIYVGKSIQLKKRVYSHFNSKTTFEQILCNATAQIEIIETGSELIALLLESKNILQYSPLYNTQQIDLINPYILTYHKSKKGLIRLKAEEKSFKDSENEIFYNKLSIKSKLLELQQKFFLCKRFAGIERSSSSCSDLIFCKGVCRGEEDIEEYNNRVKKALEYLDMSKPSFFIKLKGRRVDEQGFVLVKNGIYLGYGFISKSEQINSINDLEGFLIPERHTYFTTRIIDQFIKKNKSKDDVVVPIL